MTPSTSKGKTSRNSVKDPRLVHPSYSQQIRSPRGTIGQSLSDLQRPFDRYSAVRSHELAMSEYPFMGTPQTPLSTHEMWLEMVSKGHFANLTRPTLPKPARLAAYWSIVWEEELANRRLNCPISDPDTRIEIQRLCNLLKSLDAYKEVLVATGRISD